MKEGRTRGWWTCLVGAGLVFCWMWSAGAVLRAAEPRAVAPWRFALRYEVDDLLVRADVTRAFLRDFVAGEAAFFAHARDARTGLALEGFDLDPATGLPLATRHRAGPGAEALDVALCVKALRGNGMAGLLLSPADPSQAPTVACRLLERKIATYERVAREHAPWGGFLADLEVGDDLVPRVVSGASRGVSGPSQVAAANARWAWTVWLAEDALRCRGQAALAQRFQALHEILAGHAARILSASEVGAPSSDVAGPSPGVEAAVPPCGMADPAVVAYLSLVAPGSAAAAARRMCLGAAAVETPWGTGWRSSAARLDEELAFLFLPLRDDPSWRRLFRTRQVIRTRLAVDLELPGLVDPGDALAPPVAFSLCQAFPVLLECAESEPPVASNYGAAWLLNMLRAQRMQGPLGAGSGATMDGRRAVFTKRVEETYPVLLAICGGLEREMRTHLEERRLYKPFRSLASAMLAPLVQHKEILQLAGFAPPRVPVPVVGISDYEGARPVASPPGASPSPRRSAIPSPSPNPSASPRRSASPSPSASPRRSASPSPRPSPSASPNPGLPGTTASPAPTGSR